MSPTIKAVLIGIAVFVAVLSLSLYLHYHPLTFEQRTDFSLTVLLLLQLRRK